MIMSMHTNELQLQNSMTMSSLRLSSYFLESHAGLDKSQGDYNRIGAGIDNQGLVFIVKVVGGWVTQLESACM